MTGRKVQNGFIMVFFLVMLILPLLFADWLGGAVSQEERRVLAKAPWSMEVSPGFRISLENWINDNAGFRTQAMQAKISAEFHLFRQSAVPNNLIGREDWIYHITGDILADYTGENLWTDWELQIMNDGLVQFNTMVEENGAKLLMAIVPDKKTVYPEYYSPYIRHETNKTRTRQVAESIRENVPAPLVVLTDELLEKKKIGTLYFPRLDSAHWNSLGAYVGYEALMREAAKLLPNIRHIPLSQCTITETTENGTFYHAVPLSEPSYQIVNDMTIHQILNAAYLDRYPFLTFADVPESYKVYMENSAGTGLPRILYVGDSYGIQINQHLSQSASSLMYVHFLDIPQLPKLLETEKFDLVIFEMAERMFDHFNGVMHDMILTDQNNT